MTPVLRCDELHPFFDGELAPPAADAFRGHLGVCARCQRELDDVMQLGALGTDLATEARATPAQVIAIRPESPGRLWSRRSAIAAVSTALAAAAAIAFVVGPRGDGDPFRLGPTRAIEARLTHPAARKHRDLDVARSARQAAVPVPLAGLARLEERGDLHGVATGHLLRGEREQAARLLAKAPASPEVKSDQAVLALQKGAADEALVLLDGVLEERPGFPAAIWNRGLALRELGLPLAAAEAFGEIVKLREPGWAEEASRRAASLSGGALRSEASWRAVQGAGRAMLAGGELLTSDLVRSQPASARGYLYESLRTAPSAARARQLRPVAEALDALSGGASLRRLVDRVAASDFSRRAEVAGSYRQLVARTLDAAGVALLLEETAKADFPDLRIGVLWHTRAVAQRFAEYEHLAAELGDPWFANIALHEAAKALMARRPLEALPRLQAALRHAAQHRLDQRAILIELDLSSVAVSLHRVADGWTHAQAAFRLARRAEDHSLQLVALHQLATVARLRLSFSLARAYLREALLRNASDCDVGAG